MPNAGVAYITGYARTIWQQQHHVGVGFAHTVYKVYIVAIEIPWALTVDRIGFTITNAWTGAASDKIAVGIYKDMGLTPEGGSLLASGQDNPDAAGNAKKWETAISDLTLQPGIIWIAYVTSSVHTSYGYGANMCKLPMFTYTRTTVGLDNPCPTVTEEPTQNQPYLYLRVKSNP